MKTTLPPIVHRDGYNRAIESEILAWFNEAIFIPLLIDLRAFNVPVSTQYQAIKYDELAAPTPTRSNAGTGAIEAALASGRITYANGKFIGKFSASISRELRALGASFDTRDNSFVLTTGQMTMPIRSAVFESITKNKALHEQVIATLNAIQGNVAIAPPSLDFDKAMDYITGDLNKQFVTTTSGIDAISVQPQFTEVMRQQMDAELTNNVDLAIKNFAQERLPELRRRVEENVLQGMRSDRLAKIIESEFGVDKRKAAFLADQEAGLVTAKYRKVRYKSIGVQEYIWQTSGDVRVRTDHKALNGRRFNFDTPPVCDNATGRRCNPGEDFRCRCVARPIVSFGGVENLTEDAA